MKILILSEKEREMLLRSIENLEAQEYKLWSSTREGTSAYKYLNETLSNVRKLHLKLRKK